MTITEQDIDMANSPRADADFLKMLKKKIEVTLAQTTTEQPPMAKEDAFDLSDFAVEEQFAKEMKTTGFKVKHFFHNAAPSTLVEEALRNEKGSYLVNTGALAVSSGIKTGRSPSDKRIVSTPAVKDIWWGKVNMPVSPESFAIAKERALDYLNTRERLYVVDAYAGWDEKYRIKVRVITSRAYHALFMQNMLVMPTCKKEIASFVPDFTIYNAGEFPANRHSAGMTSCTSIQCNFEKGEMVILGSEYAGEMKKGVLTLMMYAMPLKNQLCLHSSATASKNDDITLFFGLSGTGKTTLSADPNRDLIGDDEHVWTDEGVFNVEGGCYAKCVDLTREKEPEIYDAIKYGAVVENVVFNAQTRAIDFKDTSITENTRACYPLSHIPNARIPAIVKRHPTAVVLLCCDAFGVIPPVSLLTNEQVQYYFISGYTAKVAGTEMGIKEPQATFSPCFGGPFLVWHPTSYAELLAKRLTTHNAVAYLLNTGWIGGGYSTGGQRCPIKYTRKIVDAINSGKLRNTTTERMPVFNLPVPVEVEGVPSEILRPWTSWEKAGKTDEYNKTVKKLAGLFTKNFEQYADKCTAAVKSAGPAC